MNNETTQAINDLITGKKQLEFEVGFNTSDILILSAACFFAVMLGILAAATLGKVLGVYNND